MTEKANKTIKKLEEIMKSGEEPPKELFPNLDRNGPPVVINAVEMSSLTPTEAAFYYASTSTRAVPKEEHTNSAKKSVPEPAQDELKASTGKQKGAQVEPAGYPAVKENRRGKRKEPFHASGSGGEESGGEDQPGEEPNGDKGKKEEEERCGACMRKYEDGDKMIGCDGACNKWYHIECVGVTSEEFDFISKDKKGTWKCVSCLQGSSPPAQNKGNGSKGSGADAGRKKKKIGK